MKIYTGIIAAAALAAALGTSPARAESATRIAVPPVPLNLEVPAGQELFLAGYAEGTQNYVCLPAAAGVAWRFLGPQATLFSLRTRVPRIQLTTHFLSGNPAEADLPRPTWQHSIDSSRVWGRVRASSADPNYVEAGAIPWLLVEAAGTERGPLGGLLAETTFIHRVNTSGGVAPSTGCTDAGHVGAVVLVPYSTDYFFYRASRDR